MAGVSSPPAQFRTPSELRFPGSKRRRTHVPPSLDVHWFPQGAVPSNKSDAASDWLIRLSIVSLVQPIQINHALDNIN